MSIAHRPLATRPCLRVRAPLMLVLLLASASTQAALVYGAKSFVEAIVTGRTTQRVALADPDPGPLRTDSSQVRAGREVVLSGPDAFFNDLTAQASASAEGSGNGLRARASSTQQRSNSSPFQSAVSKANAEAVVNYSTTVLGAPGSSGTLTLRARAGGGVAPAPAGDAALSSRTAFQASMFASSLAPGATRCRLNVACSDSESFSTLLFNGATLVSAVDLQWELQITVHAGDVLTFGMNAGSDVSNGYSAYAWVGLPWDGNPPVVATSDRQAVAEASTAPVPEPATWLSLIAGLVLLSARRCARRDA